MKITGIICEYNPLHRGHKKQINTVRAIRGEDSGVVCLMSGNYVQRGAPALIEKAHRAKAAVLCGADLVLELPVTYALSSAEGFAAGGVRLLSGFCDALCFGAENADKGLLLSTASALLQEDFPDALRLQLDCGLSFPAAREAALASMGADTALLKSPNNILAVEYCKAILSQKSPMEPMPIFRGGSYHDTAPEADNPSATAVRQLLLNGGHWQSFIPEEAVTPFTKVTLHSLAAGERAVLAKLRSMTDPEFEALPYGAEGLWRKFMHAVRKEATLEAILTSVKSKRYTRSRLDRMLMCAFLGITQQDLQTPAPYARVLAFNDRGRQILKTARATGNYPNIGQRLDNPYQALEDRCGSLYGLFAQGIVESPGVEADLRVFHFSGNDSIGKETPL